MTLSSMNSPAPGHQIAHEAGPSVVGVGRRGTGVVVAPGLVATNAHNVSRRWGRTTSQPRRRGDLRRRAGRRPPRFGPRISTATSPCWPSTPVTSPPIEWAETAPEPGDVVFALANPGGRGTRLSFGIVSSVGREFRGPRGRRIAGSLEHTAPLARGSSGGPVLDRAGRAIGLNTHRLGEGFYLALPVDEALRARLDDLVAGHGPDPALARCRGGAAPGRTQATCRRRVSTNTTACSSAPSIPTPRRPRPASARATSSSKPAVAPITSVDDLHAVLDDWTEPTVELRVLRGTDTHTISVTFD